MSQCWQYKKIITIIKGYHIGINMSENRGGACNNCGAVAKWQDDLLRCTKRLILKT